MAQTAASSAINSAIKYVNEFLTKLEDPYQTALVTYALTTAQASSRTEAFELMYKMKRSGKPEIFNYYSFLLEQS